MDVQDHALYYEKEFKCLVNVQDHALYYEKDLKCLVYVHCTRPCTVQWKRKRIKMFGGCKRPCTVHGKRIKMSGGCTRPCTVLWKELKCLVDVQDHALYTMKKN